MEVENADMTAGTLLVLCYLWELIKATQAMVAFRD